MHGDFQLYEVDVRDLLGKNSVAGARGALERIKANYPLRATAHQRTDEQRIAKGQSDAQQRESRSNAQGLFGTFRVAQPSSSTNAPIPDYTQTANTFNQQTPIDLRTPSPRFWPQVPVVSAQHTSPSRLGYRSKSAANPTPGRQPSLSDQQQTGYQSPYGLPTPDEIAKAQGSALPTNMLRAMAPSSSTRHRSAPSQTANRSAPGPAYNAERGSFQPSFGAPAHRSASQYSLSDYPPSSAAYSATSGYQHSDVVPRPTGRPTSPAPWSLAPSSPAAPQSFTGGRAASVVQKPRWARSPSGGPATPPPAMTMGPAAHPDDAEMAGWLAGLHGQPAGPPSLAGRGSTWGATSTSARRSASRSSLQGQSATNVWPTRPPSVGGSAAGAQPYGQPRMASPGQMRTSSRPASVAASDGGAEAADLLLSLGRNARPRLAQAARQAGAFRPMPTSQTTSPAPRAPSGSRPAPAMMPASSTQPTRNMRPPPQQAAATTEQRRSSRIQKRNLAAHSPARR